MSCPCVFVLFDTLPCLCEPKINYALAVLCMATPRHSFALRHSTMPLALHYSTWLRLAAAVKCDALPCRCCSFLSSSMLRPGFAALSLCNSMPCHAVAVRCMATPRRCSTRLCNSADTALLRLALPSPRVKTLQRAAA